MGSLTMALLRSGVHITVLIIVAIPKLVKTIIYPKVGFRTEAPRQKAPDNEKYKLMSLLYTVKLALTVT
jgi:hypothetical protein